MTDMAAIGTNTLVLVMRFFATPEVYGGLLHAEQPGRRLPAVLGQGSPLGRPGAGRPGKTRPGAAVAVPIGAPALAADAVAEDLTAQPR
jgi:hypothetical protein